MRSDIKAIAWDFDGVLNRNVVDGRFVWSDTIEEDLGIPARAFQEGVFDSRFIDVIAGKRDLLEHVQSWLDLNHSHIDANALLDYWFVKDDLSDPLTGSLLDRLNQLGIVQVIATNNEHRRASYIEHKAGYGERVSAVFAAGRMGLAKPAPGFFVHVSDALCLPPQNILLIDDSETNTRAAKALGWDTFHFTDESRDQLAPYLGL
ncbi:HAD-IA family hydrolase [Roseibium sp. SCPC15]|uniref:HAD family hydrolase n=1 Tax=Roseibium sp. SCP15 TaxID=3141376 RepID=UPI00333A0954